MPTVPHMRRALRLALALALGLAPELVSGLALAQNSPTVLVTEIDGAITPVIADHLVDGVERAEEGGYEAFVMIIDTPGGLDTSMRDIVQAFLGSRIPVVAYVSPAGARAASAGTFITMAGHVAAMAPGTTIGAATPVDLQGGEISDKIINDAAAFAESVANFHGRNVDFAIAAVRDGRSVTADTALDEGIVDLVSRDLAELLDAIDGRTVTLASGAEVTLTTAGAAIEDYDFSFFRGILKLLADPNLAFLFISIGTLAVIYEVANPSLGLAGAIGAILLILGFFSLSVLPVNAAGLALMLLAAALFIGELFVPGVGVLAAGGTLALLVGGLFLFEGSFGVSPALLWPLTIVVGLGALLMARFAWKTRSAPSIAGPESFVGRRVELGRADGQHGQVFVEGAWWRVRSSSGQLRQGETVEILDVEGLELIVEPKQGATQ